MQGLISSVLHLFVACAFLAFHTAWNVFLFQLSFCDLTRIRVSYNIIDWDKIVFLTCLDRCIVSLCFLL